MLMDGMDNGFEVCIRFSDGVFQPPILPVFTAQVLSQRLRDLAAAGIMGTCLAPSVEIA